MDAGEMTQMLEAKVALADANKTGLVHLTAEDAKSLIGMLKADGSDWALKVILEAMHEQMQHLQEMCLEAMQKNVEAIQARAGEQWEREKERIASFYDPELKEMFRETELRLIEEDLDNVEKMREHTERLKNGGGGKPVRFEHFDPLPGPLGRRR